MFRDITPLLSKRGSTATFRISVEKKTVTIRPGSELLGRAGLSRGDGVGVLVGESDDLGVVRLFPNPSGWKLRGNRGKNDGPGRSPQIMIGKNVGGKPTLPNIPDRMASTVVEDAVFSNGAIEFALPWIRRGAPAWISRSIASPLRGLSLADLNATIDSLAAGKEDAVGMRAEDYEIPERAAVVDPDPKPREAADGEPLTGPEAPARQMPGSLALREASASDPCGDHGQTPNKAGGAGGSPALCETDADYADPMPSLPKRRDETEDKTEPAPSISEPRHPPPWYGLPANVDPADWDAATKAAFVEAVVDGKTNRELAEIAQRPAGSMSRIITHQLAREIAECRKVRKPADPFQRSPQPDLRKSPMATNGASPSDPAATETPKLSAAVLEQVRTKAAPALKPYGYTITKNRTDTAFMVGVGPSTPPMELSAEKVFELANEHLVEDGFDPIHIAT